MEIVKQVYQLFLQCIFFEMILTFLVVVSHHKLLSRSMDTYRGTSTEAERFVRSISRTWDELTSSGIDSAAQNPLELLMPIMQDMEDFFSRDIDHMHRSLQSWVRGLESSSPSIFRAFEDDTLLKAWYQGRSSLESFQKINSTILGCQEEIIAQGVFECVKMITKR